MGPTRAEFHHARASGGMNDTRGFRRDHRRVIDRGQEERFDELSFDNRSRNSDKRFVGKNHLAFGHGPNITAKTQRTQVVAEALRHRVAKRRNVAQVVDFVFGKPHVLQVIEQALDPHGDHVAASFGQTTNEHFAGRMSVLHAAVEITGGHRELIEIGAQCVHEFRE